MKSRYWSFIVYPESVLNDWEEVLCKLGCVFAVSPLHDRDINANGEVKKPHYHVLVQFDGPTTYKNVKESICDVVGGTIPQRTISLRGYYRYLCHLDNPEKAQYDINDIKCYGGFKMDLTTSEINIIKSNILEDIKKHGFIEYVDLCDYYKDIGDFDYFEIVCNNTFFFSSYLKSLMNKINASKKKTKASDNICYVNFHIFKKDYILFI